MLSEIVFFYFSFLAVLKPTESLVKSPSIDISAIIETEAAIRNVTNKLFSTLQLRKTKGRHKLKDYSTIHKYFVSSTLQDYDNLKKVLKIIKQYTIDNRTVDLTAAINEVLNEDRAEERNYLSDDENVVRYVEDFLSKLADFKETYLVNNTYSDINSNILDYFHGDQNKVENITERDEIFDSFNSTDVDFWDYQELSGRRIYKGQRTKIKYFPFMASVQIFNQFQCGGSIIKSDLVITACSCVQLAYNNRFYRENPSFLSVRVGSDFYNVGGEVIPIIEVYFHPEYNPKSLKDNLALLRLRRHIHFSRRNKKVKKINFDRNPGTLSSETPGITIVGWGAKTASNKVHNPWSNKISFSVLDIYPLKECQDVYSKEYVTRKHFCAGFISKGGGACNRDVGGPGIVQGILMGVVTFGSPTCGTEDAPTVFTKLGFYYNWIEEIMEMDVPRSKVKTTLKQPFTYPEPPVTHKYETTNFKIEPLGGGRMKPISITDIDDLRSGSNQLFKEFLQTMFTSKELEEYEDKGGKKIIDEDNIHVKDLTRVREVVDEKVTEKHEENFAPVRFVTTIDDFDAASDNLEVEISLNEVPTTEAIFIDKYTDNDENVKEEENNEEILRMINNYQTETKDSSIGLEIEADKEPINHFGVDNSGPFETGDKENQDLDIEKVIETVVSSNSNDRKVIDSHKLIEMIENNDKQNKGNDIDESVLTLLYLTDQERKDKDMIKPDETFEKNEGIVHKSEKDSLVNLDKENHNYKDLTTLKLNTTNLSILSKDELIQILAETMSSKS